jgi:hypothetical protein
MFPTVIAKSSMSFKASSSLLEAQGFQNAESYTRRLSPVGENNLSRPGWQAIQHLRILGSGRGLIGVEEHYRIVHHNHQGIKLGI